MMLTPLGTGHQRGKMTYRVEIKKSGTPPNEAYGWEIYRNLDVLPILRSEQLFVSRMSGLADANRSRLQLVDTDMKKVEGRRDDAADRKQ